MSHPPETSLSSRELADRIVEEPTVQRLVSRDTVRDLAGCEPVIAALIDAWVRVREATVRYETLEDTRNTFILSDMDDMNEKVKVALTALVTARKQLEEKT